MAKSIYIASAEPRVDKIIVALGMMELLWNHAQKVGFFKPVIHETIGPDPTIHLIKSRYSIKFPYESLYGCTLDEAKELIASDQSEELLKIIMEKFKALEAQCDFVLCSGSDYRSAVSPVEFDFNVDVANNLGCLIMPVVKGQGRSMVKISEAVTGAVDALEKKHCDIFAVVVNRVQSHLVIDASVRLRNIVPHNIPIFTLAENEALWKPTVCEIAEGLHASFLSGQAFCLKREVTDFKVAAMRLANFLDHITEGTMVITPGDRDDITVGSILADASSTYARIGGIILTGGFKPSPQVQKLIDGFAKDAVPILLVESDTFTTAVRISLITGTLDPDNTRKIETALGIFESGVDSREIIERLNVTRSSRITPLMFEYALIQRAKTRRRHIVMPEGEEARILQACELLLLRDVVDITLLGNINKIRQRISELGLRLEKASILDPATSELRKDFADTYFELRKSKGITKDAAFDAMADSSYFGTMMVYKGLADGMVSGSINTTAHTIRPALEFVKTKPGTSIVSSVFLMCLADRVLVFGDCAVNTNPDEKQLADIAISSAETAAAFGIEPMVAMLSYSTGESGKGKDVDKVREAARIAKELRPDLKIEGPLQFDAAIDLSVAKIKLPDSEVAGHATVFIFPDLNTGNNTYKAVQRSANAVAIGPILQGLNKPVNDLSRGCTVADILNTVTITAIQSQSSK
ncbi:MAG TPA: phosphate acetyltransferase [Dissulfurispiraceae bacterium]|nr:phosphate acetyltransferase [Dissulfurispiraceae bacterium]